MARSLNIIQKVIIASITGLEPSKPHDSPLNWNDQFSHEPPSVLRIIWLPMTEEMHVSTQGSHDLMFPQPPRCPDAAWLRSFYFPDQTFLAVRPYFYPEGPDDWWDQSHEELQVAVSSTYIYAIKRLLSKTFCARTDCDNKWLEQNCGLVVPD